MRVLVVGFSMLMLAQPALAREHSHGGFHGGFHHDRGHHRGWWRGHHYGWRHHHHWRRGWHSSLQPPQAYAAVEPVAPDFTRRDPMFAPLFAPAAPRVAVAPPLGEPRIAVLRRRGAVPARSSELDAMIARHAQANGLPESLVRRVVIRESRYNPRAVGRGGAMGLMQIKPATARAMGYSGSASGLLNAETNLTYAVRYLAGAYRAAGGNSNRAVGYYARGYYYAAKRRGIAPYAPPVAAASTRPFETASVAFDRPTLFSHRRP